MSKSAMSAADIIDAAAKGRIGHEEAMERLGLDSYPELIDTMHANGRTLWAHRRPTSIGKETLNVLRQACLPPAGEKT